jgi:hypothetical protein
MLAILFQLFALACVIGVAVAGYFIWDRHRYRGNAIGDFRPTGEVFRDPSSGKMTRVYEDPTTGSRQYREDP